MIRRRLGRMWRRTRRGRCWRGVSVQDRNSGKAAAILFPARWNAPSSVGLSSRAWFGLSGVTPGKLEELGFSSLELYCATCADLFTQGQTRWGVLPPYAMRDSSLL